MLLIFALGGSKAALSTVQGAHALGKEREARHYFTDVENCIVETS